MLLKETTEIATGLKAINANCVVNGVQIANSLGIAHVHGYVGLHDPNSNALHIAYNWIKNGKVESAIYELTILPENKIRVARIELVGTFVANPTHESKLLYSFIEVMIHKVAEKVRNYGKKGGGKYNGRRLEAWRLNKKAPKDHFDDELGKKFTKEFIDRARGLNITYK